MLLDLPLRPAFGLPGLGRAGLSQPETIFEGGARVEYQMENIHLTKRRCSGGIDIDAPAEAIWSVLTAWEALPEVVPNIISHAVTRHDDGRVTIEQVSQLSRRMNLRTQMTLEASEDRDRWEVRLQRLGGHGFLEFEGKYTLRPQPGGSTLLSYSVELTPCPIFPLPLVERKIRKEVPKMLVAVRDAVRLSSLSSGRPES